jgi:putative intracellular protease/amidase
VPLQQLLDHTLKRILELDPLIEANLQKLAEENDNQMTTTLIYKYGFDGSGSHQRQIQPDQAGDHSEVKTLFAPQLVPLQISVCLRGDNQAIWESSRPNSPHTCRPLRLSFEMENKESSIAENERLSIEIANLRNYKVSEDPIIFISYRGLMTQVDGKVVSSLTNGNTTRCTVCDATRSEMAKNKGPFNPISDQRLSFGLSPLHFGLRAFEALLHIAYKQDVKTFISRKNEDKEKINKRTKTVKEAFLTELGLKVDRPKEGGSGGNTNTGNVVRKAFKNAQVTASICGVSTILVSNLDTIWRTLSCGKSINPDQFEKFCNETLQQYMVDCGWYSLPPTLHRTLVHGKDIINATPITIGATSKEGSEANAKFARKFLKHHSRKTSHKDTIFDLFHRLIDISDPFVIGQSFASDEKLIHNIPADMALLISDSQETFQNQSNVSICNISKLNGRVIFCYIFLVHKNLRPIII